MNHKDLYINKITFKCLELTLQESYSLEKTIWIKIPEEAEECYYFYGSNQDIPEGIDGLFFFKNNLKHVWNDDQSVPNWCYFDVDSKITGYVKDYGKLVWKRDVDTLADAVHHPKHYTSDDCGVEAIEVTSLLPACISNAVKYVWRCGKKDEDLQELKKALWYINYSIANDLPSFVNELSDSLEFQSLVEKVKSHWVGNKYMFIDAVYWGNQETMKKALELMIEELET